MFKSKWFWICAVLSVCALIFFGLVVHQANQRQEIIKVYKATMPSQSVTPHTPEESSVPVPTRPAPHDAATKMDIFDDTAIVDFSDSALDDTDAFTHTADDFFADESYHLDSDDAAAPELDTDTAPAAGEPDATQRLAKIRIEIPQALQERLDVLDLVEALAPSNGAAPELAPLREELRQESRDIRTSIFYLISDYFRYTNDISPFKPGGEFYDLMCQNNIGVKRGE